MALAINANAASFSDRYGGTATLLPDGKVLVIGGQTDDTPTLTGLVQMHLDEGGSYQNMSTTGFVDRTSHTATLLPTGEVLVAGGITGAGTVQTSVQIFNPRLNCWSTSLNLSSARMNHTATLLENGKVLICGGNDNSTTLSTCQLYQQPATPSEISCGGAPPGSLSASINMLVPRSFHTATLLSDGRVFFTGGLDTSGGSPLFPYLFTSERYDPNSNSFTAAAPLATARGYHRASLMGNGKVLITGGHNNRDVIANRGFLSSTEIYDPVANTMSPAAPMITRKQEHSSITRPDGAVSILGGLGNITTTYIAAAASVESGVITGCFDPASCPGNVPPAVSKLSTMAITGGSYDIPLDFTLGTDVSGIIVNGSVLFSQPKITFPNGFAILTYGAEDSLGTPSGSYADLVGTQVYCKEDGTCGHITDTFTIAARGQYFITPDFGLTTNIAAMSANSFAHWAGGLTINGPISANLDPTSTFKGQIVVTGLPENFIGHNISSGVLHVTGGAISIPGRVDISLADGWATIPANTPITQAADLSGRFAASISISSFNAVGGGVVTATTDTVQTGPLSVVGAPLDGLTGSLKFVVDGITFDPDFPGAFTVDIATVVIRKMIFGDTEIYSPVADSWSHGSRFSPVFGQTATLMPNSDEFFQGGRYCTPATCPTLLPTDLAVLVSKVASPFSETGPALSQPRSNHSSTLLPDGRVLVAGGSNGPNLLATAEIFDPETNLYTTTDEMAEVRDLHAATLLVNGRVLVTGGYTTNAVSSGATNGAEIYYPTPGVWVPAPPMPFATNNHTATLLPDGTVLVAGGYSNGVYVQSAAIYYSTSGIWASLPDMPTRRALHTATLLQDGRVLFVGGINETGALCSTLIYDRNASGGTAPWVVGAPLNIPGCTPTYSHTATLLKDGNVLVAGGNDGFGETNLSALYRPAPPPYPGGIGSWTNSASIGNQINARRFNHSAMMLPSGKVMIVGGSQVLGNSIRQVEVYDVSFSTWQMWGDLSTPRANTTMTMLRNGYITVIGGNNGVTVLDTMERQYFSGSPDSQSLGVPATVRQASITAVDLNPFREGSFVTLTGHTFQSVGEASGGGSASGHASYHNPRLVLQSVAGSGGPSSQGTGEFTLDLTTQIYAKATGGDPNLWTKIDTSMTIQMPANTDSPYPGLKGGMLPYGWYHLRAYNNAIYSNSRMVQAGPPKPPGAPGSVGGVVLGQSSITWSWSIGSNGLSLSPRNFDGYAVYASSSGILITTMSFTQTSFTQTSLTPNTTGAIAVAAFSLTGDGPLAYSSTYYSAPATPTFPDPSTFTAVGFNSLTLNWNANGNNPGTRYEVYQSTDVGFVVAVTTPVPLVVSHTTTTAGINFLENNTTYYFRVRAFDGANISSDYSVIVSTRTRQPIVTLTGSALNTTTIQWNWTNPGTVLFYRVYNSTTGALIATPTTNTYDDVFLATNTLRSVMVSAVTDAGEGPLSAGASAYTLAAPPSPLATPYVNVTTGSFTALWTANGNPFGTVYEFEAQDVDDTSLQINTTVNFDGSYAGFPLAASLFKARVRAFNGDNIPSGYAVFGTSSTLARPPSNLTVTGTTPSTISIGWSSNVNSSTATYEVTYSSDNFVTTYTALPFSQKSNQTSLTIGGLLTATLYEIRVQAQNYFGVSTAFSNSVTTSPFNGGVPFGSLGQLVHPGENTVIIGSVGNPPRFLSLTIPAYTFPADTFITISTFTIPPSPCPNGSTIGISITAAPPLQPLKPMFLTFAYLDAELGAIPTSQAALMRVDSPKCVPLKTTVNTSAHEVNAQLNHLSQFQVAQVSPSANTDNTLVFPNPFYVSRGNGYMTFAQMPAASRVRIFTMRGELIFDQIANGSGLLTWPGTNQIGRAIGSGVYLATIEANGEKKILKLVVLR